MQKFLFPIVLVAALIGWLLAQIANDVVLVQDFMALAKTLFLSVLRLIVAPLIFFSLLSGILNLRAASDLKRLSATTLGYYLTTTGIAIALGLFAVFWIHPWTASPPPAIDTIVSETTIVPMAMDQVDTVLGLLRSLAALLFVNPFHALANLNILGIVANGVIFALAMLVVLPPESPVIAAVHGITRVMYQITAWAMWLLPFGVAAIVYQMAGQADVNLIGGLFSFALLVVAMTLVHGFVVLPVIGGLIGKRNPLDLARHAARPFLVALTTSSSAATLPVSFRAAASLEVNPSTASFVLPLGATINMDGTALFEGIAAIYLAYLFGIELSTMATVSIFIVAMLASIGAPGIPSGSMAGMQMVLLSVGIPLEGIAILLLVERPLDTIRTAINVEGDLVGCVVVDRFARLAPATVP